MSNVEQTHHVCHGVATLLIEKFFGDGTPTGVGEVSVRVERRTGERSDRVPSDPDPSGCDPSDRDPSGRERVAVELDGEPSELTRAGAVELRAALSEALSEHREYVHTAGEHRADGRYVVSRRGAESSGHRKVFEAFGALEQLYDDLPGEFAATDLDRPGLSGGRRHLLVRHFAEHPVFDCSLVRRQPLTACKQDDRG